MSEVVGLKIQVDSNAGEAVGSLRSQLRQAQADVAEMSAKFGVTSKEAIEAAKKAGELRDRIKDAKEMADAFNPDAKFKALSASLSGVAGGFAAVQGSMGLMGIESQDLQKQLVKVQSAMALSQGLQSLGESIDSFKMLGAVIKDRVVTAFTTLKGAIAATGFGLLAIAIGYVATNFDKVRDAVLKLVPGLETVGKWVGKLIDSVTDFVGVTSEASRTLDALKDNAQKSIKQTEKFLAEHGDQLDEWEKKRIDAHQRYNQAITKGEYDAVELKKRLTRELLAIEDERNKALQKIADEKKLKDFENRSKKQIDPITGIPIEEIKTTNKVIVDELQKRANIEIDIAKDSANIKKMIHDEEVKDAEMTADAIGNAMVALSDLVGQDTVAGKGLAIASAGISTYLSAQKAYESQFKPLATVDSPIRAALAAATAVAMGLANIRRIAAIQVPNSKGGGSPTQSLGYSFSSGGSAPLQPTTQVTTTQLTPTTIESLKTQPVRAYVVESDITANQERIKRIQGAAQFGG